MRFRAGAAAVWVLLAATAVLNGRVRETLLAPLLGRGPALPASGILLAVLVPLVTWISLPLLGRVRRSAAYLAVGLSWVLLTLAFEYLFGHYAAGRPWAEIHRVFDVTGGNLFPLVLLAEALSPWACARARGLP